MNRNCQNHEDDLLDTARGVPVDGVAGDALVAHLEQCDVCRARMVRERALTAGLRAAAQSVTDARPPALLEAQLLSAFALQHPVRAATDLKPRIRWRRAWMAAAAAVVVLAGGLTWQQMDRQPDLAPAAPQPDPAVVSEFVPWPGAASLPAFESGQLVRTELPASVLPLLGLKPEGTVTDSTVMADVLIGQDGLARAVRLATF